MRLVSSGGVTRQVGVMITHGGIHPATKWAMATAEQLVSIDRSMDAVRQEHAFELRRDIAKILRPAFEEVAPHTNFRRIEDLADQAWSEIRRIACATVWAVWFETEVVSAQMQSVIRRNLLSAADLALRTE